MPSDAVRILRGGAVDEEERIDVDVALKQLGGRVAAVLRWYGQGYGAGQAMRLGGATGNSTRYMDDALLVLTDLMNGGDTA